MEKASLSLNYSSPEEIHVTSTHFPLDPDSYLPRYKGGGRSRLWLPGRQPQFEGGAHIFLWLVS